MIQEIGSVVELKSKRIAVVLCEKSSACKHCASMEMCNAGNDNKSMLVEAHNALGATIGDRVRLAVSTRHFLQSSFLLYIVPLVFLLVGAVAGQYFGGRLLEGADPNLISALLGTGALVVSFVVIRAGTRALPRETYMPQVVEILYED